LFARGSRHNGTLSLQERHKCCFITVGTKGKAFGSTGNTALLQMWK